MNPAEYAGRYFSDEVETFCTLSVVDGQLQLEHRRLGKVALRPEAVDSFLADWPIEEVVFERDGEGKVRAFRVSNDRVLGVRFTRIE